MVTAAIRPDLRVIGSGKLLTGPELALLQKWVELNRDVILKYWDGKIENTEDAIAALKPI